jgi:hypothetical protein
MNAIDIEGMRTAEITGLNRAALIDALPQVPVSTFQFATASRWEEYSCLTPNT